MRRRGQQIGRFDKRLKFQYQVRVSDGMGGFTNTWTDDLTVWGDLIPLSGRESLSEGQISSSQQFRARIRWTNDFASELDNDYRIVYGGKNYNIHSVQNLGLDNEFFEIIAYL